jgi:RNA 2',3'-cyclic 3'-phosphodiesterase
MPEAAAPARIRAFVALELDPTSRARIAALIAELRPAVPHVRWARPESMHVTVRFLGYAAPTALVHLQGPLAEAAARCPPVDAPVRGLGTFPERGRPHVLWLGIDVPESVGGLQTECERAAVAAGFPPEPRPFRPHLTLGRWSEPGRRPRLAPVDLGRAHLERLVLFRSDTRRDGSVYTPLAAFTLGAIG